MIEKWKSVPNHKEYMVSNLGRVKSLKCGKEIILKQSQSKKGYLRIDIRSDGQRNSFQVHQLVMMAFKNHIPNGNTLVVHHKDNIKSNNRLDNLEVITNRANSFTHKKGTSKYTGVSWDKNRNKWSAEIRNGKKRIKLGRFKNEYDAHLAYQKELSLIK